MKSNNLLYKSIQTHNKTSMYRYSMNQKIQKQKIAFDGIGQDLAHRIVFVTDLVLNGRITGNEMVTRVEELIQEYREGLNQ